MNGQKLKTNVSTSSMGAGAITTTSSGAIRPRQPIAQNFQLIWVDASIDESSNHCQNTLAQLRSIVNDINIFNKRDEAVDFLTEVHGKSAFLIVEGALGQHILPLIHDIPQLDAIYLFSGNESEHKQWTKEWVKIKGVHTDIKPIYEALEMAAKQCNQDSIAVSFVMGSEVTSTQNLNQLEPSFMYTQIFKEILLEMEYDEKSVKGLANYCREIFNGNARESNIIHEFEHNYPTKSPIWWYTRECFTYQMLNRALRMLEGDTIINMGFFIHDLHKQIQELYQKQIGSYRGKSFTVYRGQGLLETDFEKLMKAKGGLMCFNNFLSTSTKQEISLRFAKNALTKNNMVGVLFKMTIDPSVSSAPFASIQDVSFFQTEAEILFSMHTVFRIGEIKKMDNTHSLYQVDLQLTADDDQQLRALTDRIRKDIAGAKGWQRLGQLLVKLSQFDKAEELYNVLLEQTFDEGEKAIYYHQLGYIKDGQGDYEKAIEYYQKRLEIQDETLSPDDPSLATSYNNIGEVYRNIGEYSKALSFYEKALEIDQKTLPSNHPLLAISYNNIGEVYNNMGEYSKALSFYEKTHEMKQKTLPPNHPSLAISYNNIGGVYDNMGEYLKALSFYEKTREIFEKTLPPNHPSLATSYNNIGEVYRNMTEYSEALSFYGKALEIDQKTLPPNHPSLATSYNNIGEVYMNMREYSKALSFYEKAREIFGKTLSSNHPSVATSYNNIGGVYDKMGEYSKALSFYKKALGINEKTLPPNHSSLATSYNNIGAVYNNMGECSKALSYYERALNIFQSLLPSNHPNIKTVQGNIEYVKKKL